MAMAELLNVDVGSLAGVATDDVLARIEVERRRLDALAAQVIAHGVATERWTEDGHRSVQQWVSAVTNCSPPAASQHVRRSRIIGELKRVADAWVDGDVGTGQVDELARLLRNPRAAHHLAGSEELLLEQARTMRFADFTVVTERWLAYADPDGHLKRHDDARKQRSAGTSFVGPSFRFNAAGDTATGVELRAIYEQFTTGEFLADWDHATALYGPKISKNQLARTHQQRCYDALMTIFRTAAAAGAVNVKPFTPDVGIVIDHQTYDATLRSLLGEDAPWPDPADVLKLRCETVDGISIDPRAAVIATISGHVRQIVMDKSGQVVKYGRRRRTFPKHIAKLIAIRDRHCIWLTCPIHANHCETDHVLPWIRDGHTDLDNGDCQCGFHNRFRTRGYRVHRDENGTWHIYRPDGTEVCPLDIANITA